MRSPIINIQLNNEDITEYIQDFTYEDTLDKDNLLTLKVFPDKALEFLNRDDVVLNTDLYFQFGYLSEVLSSKHTAKISDIDTKYNRQGISITLKALDAGNILKKNSEDTIFINKTSSDIVKEIGSKYSFELNIDPTDKNWANLPQGNLSDFDFIRTLADKEVDHIFYIRNNVLNFVKRSLDKDSELTFTYGDGNDVISFNPKQTLSGNQGSSSSTLITTINNDDGSYTRNTVTQETEEDQTILNSQIVSFDSKDNVLSEIASTAVRSMNVVKTTDDEEEATNTANSLRKRERLKAEEADLTVEGNPLLIPQMIITMAGVSNRHSGNYQIKGVTHKINNGGYITTCLVHKNGTNDGGNIGSNADKTNKTVGPDTKESNVKIKTFNSETNEFVD